MQFIYHSGFHCIHSNKNNHSTDQSLFINLKNLFMQNTVLTLVFTFQFKRGTLFYSLFLVAVKNGKLL